MTDPTHLHIDMPQTILYTRDGSKVGNAILYDAEMSRVMNDTVIYLIETDFGNKMRLTAREVGLWFVVGPERDYDSWHSERDATINGLTTVYHDR